MNVDAPKFDGPRLVTLMTGEIVFNDSAAWRTECEARDIAAWPQHQRDAWLHDLVRYRGEQAVEELRKTVNEVIAVTAAGIR